MTQVVTRFAPSPTGHLHIGGARTALLCRAFAKKMGGVFILRIEDTDAARSSDESARGIMEDLHWLGIDWDEGPELRAGGDARGATVGGDSRGVGPFFQARRLDLYNRFVRTLVEQGKAYPAVESAEELEAQRKVAVAAKQTYRYDRASVAKFPTVAERLKLMDSGQPHVVRFHAPHEPILVRDSVLGDVKIAPGELDDFVIRKADGLPTYHFAVVVDDETMGVTHVLRAQEHLANTPRHVALQRALGFRTPAYAHMPLIMNMDGSKMSKRDKAKAARAALKTALQKGASLAEIASSTRVGEAELATFRDAEHDSLDVAEAIARTLKVTLPEIQVSDFREAGYEPGAINNFLALLGWNPGMKLPDGKDLEKFDMPFLEQHFSLERVGKTPSKFDRAKLLSFNADALAALPALQFAARWRAWCAEFAPELTRAIPEGDARWEVLSKAVQPRAKTYRDAVRAAGFALLTDDGYAFDPSAVEKNLLANSGAGAALLTEFRQRLASASSWESAALHALMEAFVRDKGLPNPGPIAQALRVALTGAGVSPGIGETLAVIGRESSLKRIDRCLAALNAAKA